MNPLPESSSPPVDARVACVDGGASPTTNKACPEPTSKLDDHGRGGFVIEAGGFYRDRLGRKRGPLNRLDMGGMAWSVKDQYAFMAFHENGSWLYPDIPSSYDLIAPWIDWKAVAEVGLEALDKIANHRAGESRSWDVVDEMLDIAEGAIATAASLKGEGAGE